MHQSESHEIRILDGSSFFISDEIGDAQPHKTQGMFFHDTRFLSTAILRINGTAPYLLSTKDVDYFSSRFFLTLPFSSVYDEHPISIVRSRLVGEGIYEQVFIQNNGSKAADFTLSLHYDADFADLFELKGGAKQMERQISVTSNSTNILEYSYSNENMVRRTVIEFSGSGKIENKTATFQIALQPHQNWTLDINIKLGSGQIVKEPKYTVNSFGSARPEMQQSMKQWLMQMPELHSDMDFLVHAYHRTIIDLAALRFYPDGHKRPVLAAGLPWYMALFGRDNIITSYQTCFMVPELARDALITLTEHQGTNVDNFTDEAPGKILHELRSDELTQLGKLPYRPYYGSADSTPLFLILLHEYHRWTADEQLVQSMKGHAKAAIDWINKYGDIDGDGYVEYKTLSPKGLPNQCWKDSWNSIQYSDGQIAKAPLAVVEIQGYVYDAKLRCAELAERVWNDSDWAKTLRKEAGELRDRFNNDFWTDEKDGYFVVALDGEKKQVNSCTSNMGHLLWSGIVDTDKAHRIKTRLFRNDMFSGWGIRTLSTEDAGFNPIGYHIGTVWPHDNSLIAFGLKKYGFIEEALQVISALVEATHYFQYRLPEVFAGYSRSHFDFPVEFPTACSPQAWAAGTPALAVRTLLGLEANPNDKSLSLNAHLPKGISHIDLTNLRLFGTTLHASIDRNKQNITEAKKTRQPVEDLKDSKRWEAAS